MSKGTKSPKKTLMVFVKFLIFLLVTAAMGVLALICAAFVVARGPSGEASGRLCATLADRSTALAGIFFTRDEIREAQFYFPGRVVDSGAELPAQFTNPTPVVSRLRGRHWQGWVVTELDPARTTLTKKDSGASGSGASVGLDGLTDAVYIDGCLTYAGEGGDELYCVCAMDREGGLRIGGMTAYEITNSGYQWAVSADRVLVAGGVPASGLGGGFAARAALGQRANGSLILIYADGTGLYPSGITYSELAALMYEYGAVTAAALKPEGGFRIDGKLSGGRTAVPDYTLVSSGTEDSGNVRDSGTTPAITEGNG